MVREHAAILAIAGVLTGCAAQIPSLVTQPPLPARVEIVDAPFFPQEREQCGPAALATVLNFYDHATTPDTLRDWLYIPERGGSLQLEIVATARRHGTVPYPLDGSLVAMLQEVSAQHPVLVLQNLGLRWLPRWHYAVVVGYDLDAQTLTLRSGGERRWITEMGVFLNTWQRSGSWALAIVPPNELPASAKADAWLRAAADLETTSHNETARVAFTTATQSYPDNPSAWLGKANNALMSGHESDAADDFLRTLTIDPRHAFAWNNLAYALVAMQCNNEARKAIACAAQLAPRDGRITSAESDFAGLASVTNETCPRVPPCPATNTELHAP